MPEDFNKGDLVWCKMKSYPYWPGRVSDPPPQLKKPSKPGLRCIYFFGTKNFAWMDKSTLKHYQENKTQLQNANKSVSFKTAVEDIEEFIEKGERSLSVDESDPFDELIAASSTPLPSRAGARPSSSAPGSSKRKAKGSIEGGGTTPVALSKKAKGSKERKFKDLSTSSTKATSQTPKSVNKSKKLHNESLSEMDYSDLFSPRQELSTSKATVNLFDISQVLVKKKIKASKLTFGFIGLGAIGCRLLKNMVLSDHKVVIWSQSTTNYKPFVDFGAEVASSPGELVTESDITLLYLPNDEAVVRLIFGTDFIESIKATGRSVVNLSLMSERVSRTIADVMESFISRYLEVRLFGSPEDADIGTYTLLAAGDKSLFTDCETCFKSFTKDSFYKGTDIDELRRNAIIIHSQRNVSSNSLIESLTAIKKETASATQALSVVSQPISPSTTVRLTDAEKVYQEKGEAAVTGSASTQSLEFFIRHGTSDLIKNAFSIHQKKN